MKKHPLTGRKQSAKTITKRRRTIARKRKLKLTPVPSPQDIQAAMLFLTKAGRALQAEWRAGRKHELTDAEIYWQLAKRTLEGGML